LNACDGLAVPAADKRPDDQALVADSHAAVHRTMRRSIVPIESCIDSTTIRDVAKGNALPMREVVGSCKWRSFAASGSLVVLKGGDLSVAVLL